MKKGFEPGLIEVFRLFEGIGFLLILTMILWRALLLRTLPDAGSLLNMAVAALLLGYLSLPRLPDWLGRSFLPIAICIGGAGPILAQPTSVRVLVPLAAESSVFAWWQLFPALFAPALIVAWQYDFRWVIVFAAGTALLDLGMLFSASANPAEAPPVLEVILLRTLALIGVGYVVARIMHGQRELRAELAEANAQLVRYATTQEQLATSRERVRLARELHDTLAHTLSGLAVQLEAMRSLEEIDAPIAQAHLDRALATARAGLTESRRALHDLRASPLEELGLALALRSMAESTAARAGAVLRFAAPEEEVALPPPIEQGVYRIAQEAIENIARHAYASEIEVRLDWRDDGMTLTINDNGRGFDPEKVQAHHYGFKGMRERAAIIGASLEIVSAPGSGTQIRLQTGGEV